MNDAQLRTIWQQRQRRYQLDPVAAPLAKFMKYRLAKRCRQVGQLASIWQELLPAELAAHTALEGLNRGVLTVMVDSSAHRFQLQTLLAGGLLRQIQERCTGALSKVRLVPGQFAWIDDSGQTRFEFARPQQPHPPAPNRQG